MNFHFSSSKSLNNPRNNFHPYRSSITENNNTNNNILKPKNLKLDLGLPYQTNTIKQKLFNNTKPSRPYNRFIPTKISLTGVDPIGNIFEFYSKDIIHPLTRPNLYPKNFTINNNNSTNTRWALKTTVKCNDSKSLPKLQDYTTYYFPPKYNNKNVEKYRNFSLKTDHIGIKVPRTDKVLPEKNFVKLKSDFCFNSETKKENDWIPYVSKNSMNNISSQDYDIINFKPILKTNSNANILLNKSLYLKKKGIGEYADLTKTFRVNFNKEFSQKINENPLRFRKYKGIFSDMYDASHKNGDIITPFGKSKKKNKHIFSQ